ncbi:DUF6624 domain-containing protein [Streptomyces sp. BE133]|uniref:DUF6624 domain-containing protein n=1 Tax=Streptomyces sp. BE133 TaxID=3002523 RepID=UPI002E778D99|nr:DUF6624 domain-containing protein [Streptomyces sp. BE133]MEE1807634.1 hypothetical protein [Streptomyces sp. BE133]
MPGRPDIAGDLITRVEAAGATWRAPGHEREAASEGVVQAARHAVVADAQALRRIVARLGCWPGRTLVGDAGCRAALAIALNADHDPAFQVTLLKMLAEAVRRGDAAAAQWAHLRDRCLVISGRPQQYGTQYWLCDGRLVMYTAARSRKPRQAPGQRRPAAPSRPAPGAGATSPPDAGPGRGHKRKACGVKSSEQAKAGQRSGSRPHGQELRVLVDGVDMAGKPTLVRALVSELEGRGVSAVRHRGMLAGLHSFQPLLRQLSSARQPDSWWTTTAYVIGGFLLDGLLVRLIPPRPRGHVIVQDGYGGRRTT